MLMQEAIIRGGFTNFREFHKWSVNEPDKFWKQAWADLEIKGKPGSLVSLGEGFENKRWFPEAELNVVDTLLSGGPEDIVLVAYSEAGTHRSYSRSELRREVAACAAALTASGITAGDRVVAFTPNVPETMIFALGALAIGAVVSTASSDFGPAALIDRFGQIEPKLILASTDYVYAGKSFSNARTLEEVLLGLPTVQQVVVIGNSDSHMNWESWLSSHQNAELAPIKFPFDQPGFILFSSGTTGKPKCIVHSAAGVLLKVLSEQGYHLGIDRDDAIFFATTCGWMMWNWLLMGLGRGAKIVLVDGSPGHPSLERLWAIAEEQKLSFMGVSAALIDTWRKFGVSPGAKFNLSSLRTIASTGSPLATSGFDWVAGEVASNVSVASIAGGTDLCGCLVLGVETEPVVRGEIQGPALGLDVTVYRADGTPAEELEQGELVCLTPFPSVPLRFWNDDGSKRHAAYFNKFPEVWAHGDFARRTSSGGFEILGRLDATLNIKGVRIGTAEVYRVVHSIPGVLDALAVEQPYEDSTRMVLFLVLQQPLNDSLVDKIKLELRSQASPRHVPSVIVQAPELPRTRSGKLTELAVTDIVAGREVRDTSSLSNPESLNWFREWAGNN